ncbi:MAG: dihydrofolate reductase [Chloroflexi bacterium]|nr:dihydrofolate reductase [Chloroflexota bacterium]
MKFRVYIAVSVDGCVASADGGVAWLESFHDEEGYGYNDFLQQMDAIVIGRTTFDQVLGFGDWPYPGKDTYVLTSRSIENPPPQTTAWQAGASKLIEHLRGMSMQGDVWLLGGSKSIRAFRDLNAVDAYEIYVMPLPRSSGIPLFESSDTTTTLRLTDHHVFPDGVVRTVYESV